MVPSHWTRPVLHCPTLCPTPAPLQLSAALNMMNSAVDGGPPPSSWTAPPPPQPAAAPAAAGGAYGGGAAAAVQPPLPHFDASDLTLRQLVEAYAEEAGVTFMPKPGRTYEGMQVGGPGWWLGGGWWVEGAGRLGWAWRQGLSGTPSYRTTVVKSRN
jgi:hypothetical protein